jgi:hypothetical protein
MDVNVGSFRSNRNNISLHDDADEDDDEDEDDSVVLSPPVLSFVLILLPHAPIVSVLRKLFSIQHSFFCVNEFFSLLR